MFVHQMDLRAGTEITEGDTVEFGTADYKGREKAVDVIKVDASVRAAAPRALAPPGVPAKPRVNIAPARPWPKVNACVEIKTLRRVRIVASHRRDACSIAWRCSFLTARRSQHGRVIAEK